MSNYKDLEIYSMTFDLAIQVHHLSQKLPGFELFEQGSQVRRSSKSIKDQIAEGYGRKRYKADFIKFLVYAQASCDECVNKLETIKNIYPEIITDSSIIDSNNSLGKKINSFIKYVEGNWRTSNQQPPT